MSKIRYESEDEEIQLIDIPQKLINKMNKDSYNQALEDLVKKCEKAALYQFGQYYVDIRTIREIAEQLKGN